MTDQHMAEARRIVGQYRQCFAAWLGGDDWPDIVAQLAGEVAQALAQAERRAAEAQRSADIELIQATELPSEAPLPWLRAVSKRDDQLITAIRSAPLATPAGDPAPAANLASDLNLGGGLNDPKSGSAPAADVRAAVETMYRVLREIGATHFWPDGLGFDGRQLLSRGGLAFGNITAVLTDEGRRLVERGGRDGE